MDLKGGLLLWFTIFLIKSHYFHANNKIKQNQCPFDLATQKLAEELY